MASLSFVESDELGIDEQVERFRQHVKSLCKKYGSNGTKKELCKHWPDLYENVRGRHFKKEYLPKVLKIYRHYRETGQVPIFTSGHQQQQQQQQQVPLDVRETDIQPPSLTDKLSYTTGTNVRLSELSKPSYAYAIWAEEVKSIKIDEFINFILKPLVKQNPNYNSDHIYYGGNGFLYLETPNKQNMNSTWWINQVIVKDGGFFERMTTKFVTKRPDNAVRIEKIIGGEYLQMMYLSDLDKLDFVGFFQQMLETDGNVLIPLIIQYAQQKQK